MIRSLSKPVNDTMTVRAQETLLQISGVSRRFLSTRQDTTALQDVSLNVRDGEFVCIVGPSGCGKSTLLNLIAGLDRPTQGSLLLDGEPIRRPGADRVVVFQEPALFPWMNVRANVEFGLKMQRLPAKERREKADRFLDLVHLQEFQHAFVHELSGGMKQRVQLARCLAVEPRVLLMDEPFAALDAQARDALQMELQEIWQRTGSTVVFITHNVREAALLGDRVLVMTPGPGRIKAEIPIPLQRPRNPDTHAVVDFAAEVRTALQHEVYEGRGLEANFAI
jgi:NitT/TauT family transport system ATP-binding protein